jgi:hypothetical protein
MADQQPAAALAAEHRALQVVGVGALLLPGVPFGLQDSLDLVPGLHRHQRLMGALVANPPVAHNALVVGVLEQAHEVGDHQGLGNLARPRHAGQASLGDFRQQGPRRPPTGGIFLQGPAHERSAYLIHLDGADLTAVLHAPHVQVASRGLADRATELGLLS